MTEPLALLFALVQLPAVEPTAVVQTMPGAWIVLGGAAIAMLQILLLALVTGYMTNRKAKSEAGIKADERKAQWDREDAVSAQVAKAAADLLQAQRDTIKRTDEVAARAAEDVHHVQTQLIAIDEMGQKIHKLVNSDMTTARQAERDSLTLLLLALKKIGVTEKTEIAQTEKRLVELDKIIADRLAAQQKLDAEEAGRLRQAGALATERRVAQTLKLAQDTLIEKIETNTASTAESAAATAASTAQLVKDVKPQSEDTGR